MNHNANWNYHRPFMFKTIIPMPTQYTCFQSLLTTNKETKQRNKTRNNQQQLILKFTNAIKMVS